MGRHNLALVTAEATGAVKANPNRYRDAAELDHVPLGPPSPEIVAQGLAEHWIFYTQRVTWLTEADRRLVEKACAYRANSLRLLLYREPIIDDKSNMVATMKALNEEPFLFVLDHKAEGMELRILEKMGCTPTSRPKVTPPGHKGGPIARKKQWW